MRRNRIGAFVAAVVVGAVSVVWLPAQAPQGVGTWAPVGGVAIPLTGAASVALPDGRTLVAGGTAADGTLTAGVTIYDLAADAYTNVGQLQAARTGHSATLLDDGQILIVGGATDGGLLLADVEVFEPLFGTSTLATTLAEPRTGHVAGRLADGTVLIAGGATVGGDVLQSAMIFDPATSSLTPLGAGLQVARVGASGTTLLDGRVLIAGGNDGTSDLSSAELYDPASQTFTPVGAQLSAARSGHAAVLLPHNAGVLIAGGMSNGATQAGADLFLPAELVDHDSFGVGQFAATGAMGAPRSRAVAGPTTEDGYAFAAGGGDAGAEVYRYATLKTDKHDYAPGETVIIAGSGWVPGETVTLLLQEQQEVHGDLVLQAVVGPDGTFVNAEYAPEEHDLGVRYYLTATGGQSKAQMTFTDSVGLLSVSVGAQTPNPVTPASSATYSVSLDFNGSGTTGCSATLTVLTGVSQTGVPAGSVVSFSGNPVASSGSDGSSTLTITPPVGTSPGTYTFTVQAVAPAVAGGQGCQGATRSVASSLVVSAPAKVNPTVTTAIHNGSNHAASVTSVALGSTVHDSVTVTGSNGTPTGNVTFTFYSDGTCTTLTATSGSVALSGGSADATTFTQGPLAAGSYSFKAHYDGDTNYNPYDSSCEPLTVDRAQLTVTTEVHDSSHADKTNTSVALASVMHDKAALSGLVSGFAAPSVTFTFYLNGTCTGGGSAIASNGTEGGDAKSADTSALAAGSYAFKAAVAGNSNYLGDDGDCEPFTVNPASTTTTVSTTTTSPQYSDEATLKAEVTPYAVGPFTLTGTVYFYVTTPAGVTCTATPPAGSIATDSIAAADLGVAEIDAQLTQAAGTYVLTACFYSADTDFTNSGDTESLSIAKEDAAVTPDAGNAVAYQASGAGPVANFVLMFSVQEKSPEPDENAGPLPGDIDFAGLGVRLIPVGGGSPISGVCGSSYSPVAPLAYTDVKVFSCSFSNIPVEAYEVEALVSGDYYAGGVSDVLTVYDPAAGFVTGGGKFLLSNGDGTYDRVNFGLVYNFTGKGKTTPRGNLLVLRHKSDGDVCRSKSNGIGAPAVVGNTASFSGKGNYGCTKPDGTTYDGAGNQSILGWVVDNGEPGSSAATTPDRFWVNVAALNSVLAMPTPAPANSAPLTGGNIQVPQPSKK